MLETGLFVFRFNCSEEKVKVLEGGVWQIARRPLVLCHWKPGMELVKVTMDSLPVWVSLPNLPFKLWNKDALSVICSVMGKPLFFDRFTMKKERLSFARVCIEVDAHKPLKIA